MFQIGQIVLEKKKNPDVTKEGINSCLVLIHFVMKIDFTELVLISCHLM